ncbi:Uncharacterised protein [Legionella steigerwaltii]|uniref:Uncharacterized protein n=1 Tax=Legionella steigerwaltii TaxID=460 RepID=A0A378LBB9_9GAMM|nr:hypothetical protein [Legionella steigerwaltii]KTD81099.1 hypothetical protein Lstg_0326 [Legionella steigerwaltii]STY23212.1 Uncharacterised protein [Legionella steigerwaltii]
MLEMLTDERLEKRGTREQAIDTPTKEQREETVQHQSGLVYHGPSYTFFENHPSPDSMSSESLSVQHTSDETDEEDTIEKGTQEKILQGPK